MAGSHAEADGGMEVYVPVQPLGATERSHRDSWFVFMFTRGLNRSSSHAPLKFSLATILDKVTTFFSITHDGTKRTAVKGRPPIRLLLLQMYSEIILCPGGFLLFMWPFSVLVQDVWRTTRASNSGIKTIIPISCMDLVQEQVVFQTGGPPTCAGNGSPAHVAMTMGYRSISGVLISLHD